MTNVAVLFYLHNMYGKIEKEGGEPYKLTKKIRKEEKRKKKLERWDKKVDKIST